MSLRLQDFAPPILGKLSAHLRKRRRDANPDIFNGEGQLFKDAMAGCRVYGEYGMGASTRWVLANTRADIIAVDTSRDWVNHVVSATDQPQRLSARWVDVGVIGKWGRPVSYANRDSFADYTDALWRGPNKPDVVLVDGRFRVSCFLRSLLASEPGTKIIFDDYVDRPYYHLVEEILKPRAHCGRQVLFEVSPSFDREQAEDLRNRFLYVME